MAASSPPALWTKNRGLALAIAHEFFWPGAEGQDVEQEAMIGLWIAARGYQEGQGTKFRTFAALIIRRRLSTCVKTARREKHSPLNLALRTWEGSEILDQLPSLHQVADIAEDRERLRIVIAAIGRLSEFERHCVIGIGAGMSYGEIGDTKRVDNALTRARKKLREAA